MAPDPIRPGLFKDYITDVKVHNNTPWDLKFYKKYLTYPHKVNREPEDIPAKTARSGGTYQDNNTADPLSVVVVYDSPDPNWKFAWDCGNPPIGVNPLYTSIIPSDTPVDQSLFDSLESSKAKTAYKILTVEGTQYKFTISGNAPQGSPEFTADFIVDHSTDLSEPEPEPEPEPPAEADIRRSALEILKTLNISE